MLPARWLQCSCQVREPLCPSFPTFPALTAVTSQTSLYPPANPPSMQTRCCSAWAGPGDGWMEGQGAGMLPGADGRLCHEPHHRGTRAKGGHECGLVPQPSSAAHRGCQDPAQGRAKERMLLPGSRQEALQSLRPALLASPRNEMVTQEEDKATNYSPN